MRRVWMPTLALLFCVALIPALPVQAQVIRVVGSSPSHGDEDVSIDDTIRFTFDQPVDLEAVTYLVAWDGTFADRGQPFREDPFLSGDGRTVSFPVRHRENSDYIWMVYGIYDVDLEDELEPVRAVVPYVVSYTTSENIGDGTVRGSVTVGGNIEGGVASAITGKAGGAGEFTDRRHVVAGHDYKIVRATPPRTFPQFDRVGLDRLFQMMTPDRRLLAGARSDDQLDERSFQMPKPVQPPNRAAGAFDGPGGEPGHVSSAVQRPAELQMGDFSSSEHALILMEGETDRLGGAAVVELAVGTYEVEFLRDGTYLPLVAQIFPGQDGQISRVGYYDPDGDFRPDSITVTGDVDGIDLEIHDISYFAISGQDAEAELRLLVEAEYPAPDYELVSLETFTYAMDGLSVLWRAIYYSPSESRQVIADWNVASTTLNVYSGALPSTIRPIPSTFVDSDEAAAAVFADPVVVDFLETHVEATAGIFFTAGDYLFETGTIINPFPDRQLWRVKYEVDRPDSRPSITAFVDVSTGDVVDVDVFEPLPAATAEVFEAIARDLAGEQVDDPSTLELFRIRSLSGGQDVVDGAFDGWAFDYFAAGEGNIHVEMTPFGHTVEVDPWYEFPEDAPVVPQEYVDSDLAVEIAEDAGGENFRSAYGGSVLVVGGYVEESADRNPEYLSRAIWSILYEGSEGGSMAVFLDMATGELLETELYEPLQPSTAKSHEERAFDLVSSRVEDPTTLKLFRVAAFGHIPTDVQLVDGLSSRWNFSYVSPDDGLFVVSLDAWGYSIYADSFYTHPDGAPLVPEDYVDSDAALSAAEAAGGAAFREQHQDSYLHVEGGFASSFQYAYPEYATLPVWVTQYDTFDGSTLTVISDMVTGEVLGSESTGTTAEIPIVLPAHVELHPNYPNPFNPSTSIRYDLPKAMTVRLIVYDVLGREVASLVDARETAGRHTAIWNADAAASGLYFARLTAGGVTRVQTLLLQK